MALAEAVGEMNGEAAREGEAEEGAAWATVPTESARRGASG